MNMMVIIFRKEQLYSVTDGQYERPSLTFCPYFFFVLFRSIVHDAKHFNDPMKYQPERYLKDGILNPDVLDTDSIAFGFGRRLVYTLFYIHLIIYLFSSRICPGRHLADNSLYSIVSCLLAVYDIKPPVDDQGNIIKLEAEFTSEFLS